MTSDTFFIIGTGHLAHYWLDLLKGRYPVYLWGRDHAFAKVLSLSYDAIHLLDLNLIPDNKNTFIIWAIQDQAAQQMVMEIPMDTSVQISCSGVMKLDEWASNSRNKAILWPIYSINKAALDTLPASFPWAITCTDDVYIDLALIISLLGPKAKRINDDDKVKLHLAAVIINNFTNHLRAIANEYLVQEGLNAEWLSDLAMQLVTGNPLYEASNLQTGPARRGDSKTLFKHLELLKLYPSHQAIYALLSISIQKMYQIEKE